MFKGFFVITELLQQSIVRLLTQPLFNVRD